MMRGRSFGGAVVLALAFVISSVAQQYSFRFYGAAEGLQNLVVLSLAQDRAGFIWVGTEGGLYRYDGTRFRLMGLAEGLPCSGEAHGLFLSSDGALWTNTCGGIFRFDDRRFQAIPGVDMLLGGTQVMADSAGGGVLISTPTGIFEASRGGDGSFSIHSYPVTTALAGKRTHGILRQGSRLWFGCDLRLCMEENGRFSEFGPKEGLPEDRWDTIQISGDGSVWVRSPKSVYHRAPGNAKFSQDQSEIALSGFWGTMTLGRDGSVMVPTDRGLAIRTATGWSVVNKQRGLRYEMTATVLEDREGSVWMGLVGGGLVRWLGRGVWESWTVDQGLPSNVIWSIRRDRKGTLWVGTSLGLTRLDSSKGAKTTTRDGMGGDNVRWLVETSDGSIWAATKPNGLTRIDPATGKTRPVGRDDGLRCSPEDVIVDRRDRLWVPTQCGLFRNDRPSVSNQFMRVETPASLSQGAWRVLEGAQDTMWVTNREGLWSLRQGHWRHYGRADGLLTDNPYVMLLAADRSIWLRHRFDAGVDRLEVSGDRIVRSTAVVPADPNSIDLTAFHGFDAFGNFWRGTQNGVAVRRGSAWTKFTMEDGLVGNDCDGEAFWADTNGDVWLGTSSGLSHYHPRNGEPPASLVAYPIITRLEVNEPARLIRTEFSSLNYKAEQLVQFAYRMDDAPWTDTVERNITIAGLGPGRHRLDSRCRVRDGPFSPSIATAEFRVKPMWKETWWARLLALGVVLVAIIIFIKWRLNAAARKQAHLEAIVAARTANLSEANRALDENARQLRSSEERLRASETQLVKAQRLAKVGSWELDVEANSFQWSDEIIQIFGHPNGPPFNFRDVLSYVHLNDREKFLEADGKVHSSMAPVEVEFRIVRPDGEVRFARAVVEAIRNDRGAVVRITGATQDVTEQVKARELLRESEQRLKSAQQLTHVGSWHWNLEADRVVCSEECLRVFGQPDDYAPSLEGLLEMITPSERERVAGELRGGIADKSGCATEFHIIRPNGEVRAVSFTSQVLLDEQGSPQHIFGACQDITDVKKNEAKLVQAQEDLRALTARLVELQELGTKELARELHDDLSQNLSALGREIETLFPPSAQASQSLSIWQRIMKLARDVHSMSQRLHPAILDEVGLKQALVEQCWAFSERTGIPVQFESAGESTWLAADVSLCFYRVTQEGLHNIAKHAGATSVHLTLSSSEEKCTLRIEDNGQGFDPSEAKGTKALGLISMRERARLVNGNFTIRSEYGKGTMLQVSVALKTN